MSALDDKINSLSSEELDLLNSDPDILNSFKAKYASETQPSPMDKLKTGIGTAYGNAVKDMYGNIMAIPGAFKTASDLGADVLKAPAQLAQGIARGDVQQPSLLKDTQAMTDQAAQGISDVAKHPIDAALTHPVSTALLISGLMPEAGPESAVKGFYDELSDNADSSLASMNKKLANIPENATKLEGYKQPVPTQDELDQAVQAVTKAKQDVVNSHGEVLNQAKSEVGLPTTAAEKDASIRKFGNKRNLDLDKPLDLPENLKTPAPQMEGGEPKPDLPVIDDKNPPTKGPYALYGGSSKSFGDLYDIYQHPELNSASNVKNSRFGPDALELLENKKIPIIGKQGHVAEGAVPQEDYGHLFSDLREKQPQMGYKISPTKTPEELNTEIGRFLQNQDYISGPDKIKAATYYQDKIGNHVDFAKEGDETQGLLKSKYNQLKDVIQQTSPSLQQAKTNFSKMKGAIDEVDSHLDPSDPGRTHAYLKRLFLSNSPASEKALQQLQYIEQATGKPVVTNLFKKFAGQAFDSLASRPGREILEAAGGVGAAVLGHPAGLAGAAGLLAVQSPKVLGALESAASRVPAIFAKVGPMAAYQTIKGNTPMNTPDMQSLKDRLAHAK